MTKVCMARNTSWPASWADVFLSLSRWKFARKWSEKGGNGLRLSSSSFPWSLVLRYQSRPSRARPHEANSWHIRVTSWPLWTRSKMADLVISNFSHFKKHLEDHHHSVSPGVNVEALLKNNAIFNKENLPWGWKTCFLKPTEGGLYGYSPVWENDGELLRLIQDTVLFGHNLFHQDTGRVEATYNFERCIGVYSSFRNGIDASAGFKITPIYTMKMVYIPTESEDTIIGISTYPSFDPRQQSCWNNYTIIATL